jgi:hypothetical protein
MADSEFIASMRETDFRLNTGGQSLASGHLILFYGESTPRRVKRIGRGQKQGRDYDYAEFETDRPIPSAQADGLVRWRIWTTNNLIAEDQSRTVASAAENPVGARHVNNISITVSPHVETGGNTAQNSPNINGGQSEGDGRHDDSARPDEQSDQSIVELVKKLWKYRLKYPNVFTGFLLFLAIPGSIMGTLGLTSSPATSPDSNKVGKLTSGHLQSGTVPETSNLKVLRPNWLDELNPEILDLLKPELQECSKVGAIRKEMVWRLTYGKRKSHQNATRAEFLVGVEYQEWRTIFPESKYSITVQADFDVSGAWVKEEKEAGTLRSTLNGTLEYSFSDNGETFTAPKTKNIRFVRKELKYELDTSGSRIDVDPPSKVVKVRWDLKEPVQVDLPHKDFIVTVKPTENLTLIIDPGNTNENQKLTVDLEELRIRNTQPFEDPVHEWKFKGAFAPFQGVFFRVAPESLR